MSVATAPLISLEQARELVQLLEFGETDAANELVQQLAVPGSSELFAEVGKLTRQLHDSLKSFQIDPTIPEVPKYQEDMYMFVAYRKGLSYEQSKKRHQDLIQYAKSVGLEYNLDKALVTNSLKGHRLIQFAKTKGLGEKAEERLFYAYFTMMDSITFAASSHLSVAISIT